ncbi:hypothetical protein [Kitasatospora cinereorecta]|uniref:Uncharacterized protein n=1 Tax=Kitasatospora cinereorecta TaxID=285560 RepID=A0ABW0VQI8_9ACTN
METDQLLDRARDLWCHLAGAPAVFGPPGPESVVVAPASGLCPPGWSGVVVLGGALLATAPTEAAARCLRQALGQLPSTDWTDPARLAAHLPLGDALGPAALAYLAASDFRPARLRPRRTAARSRSSRSTGTACPPCSLPSTPQTPTSAVQVLSFGSCRAPAAGARTSPACRRSPMLRMDSLLRTAEPRTPPTRADPT